MIQMHTGIVTAGIVADPFAIGVDVRRVGVPGLVVKVRGCWRRFRGSRRSGTVGGDVPCAAANGSVMLSKGHDGKQEAYCEQSDEFFHVGSFSEQPWEILLLGGFWVQLGSIGQRPVISDQ